MKNKGTNKSSSMISVYSIHPPFVHVCNKFQPSRPHSFNLLGLRVSEKNVTKNFNVWQLERKKNEEIKRRSSSLIRLYMYTCPLSTCVPSFNLLGLKVSEKNVTKNFNVWKLERKKNEEIKQRISSSSSLVPVYKIHLPIVHVCTKFQSSRPHSSWEKCNEAFSFKRLRNDCITEWQNHRVTEWRKDKANIAPTFQSGATISMSNLIAVYTINCTCICSSCLYGFNFYASQFWRKNVLKNLNVWILERKKNEEIKGWINSSSLIPVYTMHLPTVHAMWIPSFNLLGLTVPEKSVPKIFNVWKFEKEKWRNKGTKKQQQSDSGIHNTSAHCPCVHQVSISLTVPEKSVTRWFQCLKIGEKEKWRNKGTNMQQQPDSNIHDSSAHCPRMYQVSIF